MVDRRIEELAAAVADGEPIDWDAARRACGPDSRPLLNALAALAPVASAVRADADSDLPRERLPWAVRLLLCGATVQMLAGSVGFVVELSTAPEPTDFAVFAAILAFGAAAGLLLSKESDRRAARLGAFYVLIASAFALPGLTQLARAAGLSGAGIRGIVAEAFLPALLWEFVRVFPATIRLGTIDRITSIAVRTTTIAGAALFVNTALLSAGMPAWRSLDRIGWPSARTFWAVVLGLMLPALLTMAGRARHAPLGERRRVTIFLGAIAAGTLPMLIEVMAEIVAPSVGRALSSNTTLFLGVALAVYMPLLAVPFVTAYAVLVQQVMHVRVIFRAALQYLAATQTLMILTIVPFAALAIIGFSRRNETVASLLSGSGSGLLGIGALGVIALASRRSLQSQVDRWFAREGQDAAHVLTWATEELRRARTSGEIAGTIAAGVYRALHARALLLRLHEDGEAFRGHLSDTLSYPRRSALAELATARRDVLECEPSATRSVYRVLPVAERRALRAAGASAIVPIAAAEGTGSLTALLVCGPRQDALGFNATDRHFLLALSEACAIALENVRLRNAQSRDPLTSTELARECPRCGGVSDERLDPSHQCGECGAILQTAALPATVLDKYRVERRLGSGGMGVVYRAEDLALGRIVAMKTLPQMGDEEVRRLHAEARTMASLSHPHLATIYGLESWNGTPLLVIEYMACGTLADQLRRGPMPTADALAMGLKIAHAVDWMHTRNLLHRDLKPANVGFNADGQPKLLDFGLSILTGYRSASDAAGTMLYMSPDALRGAPPDRSFDIWSFNVLLYEALTGTHPFGAGEAAVRRILDVSPMDIDETVPAELSKYFARAWARDPERRWQAMDEVADALAALRSTPVGVPPASSTRKA